MIVGVNTLFLIPGEVGGSETYLRRTLDEMARARPDTPLVLFTNRENDAPLRTAMAAFPQVRFEKLDFPATNRYARILREQTELPRRARQAGVDVLWSPGYTAPAFAPCPQVVSILDMQYKRHPGDMGFLARLTTDILVRTAARRCRVIVAISEFSRQEILRHTAAQPDQVVVTPLAASGAFAQPVPALAERLGRLLPFCGPYLLCVANSYPHKNLPELIDAFASLASRIPHHLVLVGRPRLGEPQVQQALARVPAPARIVRLAGMAEDDLPALYQGADLFAFPSLYEGFGLPVLEAIQAGVPVICGRRASLPEVAGDAAITYAGGAAELAAAIAATLAQPPTALADLVVRQRAQAARFSWAATAAGTWGAIDRALGGGAEPSDRRVRSGS